MIKQKTNNITSLRANAKPRLNGRAGIPRITALFTGYPRVASLAPQFTFLPRRYRSSQWQTNITLFNT